MNRSIISVTRNIYPKSIRNILIRNTTSGINSVSGSNKDSDHIKNKIGDNISFMKKSNLNNFQSQTLHTTSTTSHEPIRPTDFQKTLFILTGMYKSKAEIPEFVSGRTIEELNHESRQLVGIGICLAIVTFLYTMEFDMANGSQNNKTSLYHLNKII
uniref:Deltamethrin resistance protein prag01 domain-containing protein n=1 Tax=Strongyloides stercoralis TaxID=6248 RepID=A0A0K0EBE5_STRER